jgi:hypothetical protein
LRSCALDQLSTGRFSCWKQRLGQPPGRAHLTNPNGTDATMLISNTMSKETAPSQPGNARRFLKAEGTLCVYIHQRAYELNQDGAGNRCLLRLLAAYGRPLSIWKRRRCSAWPKRFFSLLSISPSSDPLGLAFKDNWRGKEKAHFHFFCILPENRWQLIWSHKA